MFRIVKVIKNEISELTLNKKSIILIGCLFVTVGLIVISIFNVPLILGKFKIIPGGGLHIFFCYLFSVLFFFAVGMLSAFLYVSRSECATYAKKAITDLIISYVLRLLWIILFVGYSSFIVTLVFIVASLVFLIFALICSRKISLIVSLIEIILIVEEVAVVFYNVRIIFFN